MNLTTLRWPRALSMRQLLQSPAHAVLRVMQVTQSNWQLPESHSRRARAQVGALAMSR